MLVVLMLPPLAIALVMAEPESAMWSARLCKEERSATEMERFLVSVEKRKRPLFVTPASMTTTIHMREHSVKAKGRPTQRNLPTLPMVKIVLAELSERVC